MVCGTIEGNADQEATMSTDISPENERFITREIEAGAFRTRSDAIDAGIELLRLRKELLARIDEGRRQLDQGEAREYDEESLSNRFFALKQRVQELATGQEGP